ncbi:MAG: hypothetical protein JST63_15395 [Bacteroidetes bacterium]|nr:hypothetical protein [Bacteroidota bacterium]
MLKENKKDEFPFSQYLFGDTPIEKMNVDKHKNYIIKRVLSHGLLHD